MIALSSSSTKREDVVSPTVTMSELCEDDTTRPLTWQWNVEYNLVLLPHLHVPHTVHCIYSKMLDILNVYLIAKNLYETGLDQSRTG
jgi:hypothetical protein